MNRREHPQTQRDWLDRAICRGDPELFFPVGNRGPALLQTEAAKAVCTRCPVRAQCLLWALETNQETGVWGGVSEDELRTIRHRAARNRRKAKDDKDAKDAKDPGHEGQSRHPPAPALVPAFTRA